jgi:hypothetical protein
VCGIQRVAVDRPGLKPVIFKTLNGTAASRAQVSRLENGDSASYFPSYHCTNIDAPFIKP